MSEGHEKTIDMTRGEPLGLIVRFSLPLLVGNAFQQLYNMVDSWVVGQFVGTTALAAVGIAFPVIFLLSSLFIGLSIGASVMIAQYIGSEDRDAVRRSVNTVYGAFMVSIIPLTVFGLAIAGPVLRLIQVPESTYDQAHIYLLVVFAGIIGSLGYNINAGILQGLGNSRASLLFLAISAVMNIALDLISVLVFHMGVAGVAIATIVSQFASWVFGIYYINRVYTEFAIRPFCMRLDRELFRKIMGVGLPAGLQMATVSMGMIAVMSQVNVYGTSYAAGYNVGHKLDNTGFLPVQSLATAATAFVGQNVGAKREDRVRRGVVLSLAYAIAWCAIIIAILYPARFLAAGLFTSSPGAIDGAALMLQCILPFYPLFATQYTMCNIMRGAGESVVPMAVVMLSNVFFRVPGVYLFAHFFGPQYMYYGFGLGWIFGATVTVIYFFSGRWKRRGSLAE